MAVTIKDVARRSEMSIATVSKYLNGKPIRKKSAQKISAAIHELGYRPNLNARSLRNSSTLTIGILVENITNNFYNQIISQLSDLLAEKNYGCIICETKSDSTVLQERLKFLYDRNIDGLFVVMGYIPEAAVAVMNQYFPNIVVIDTFAKNLNGDFIFTDNMAAAYGAVEQLIAQKHRKIALITGNPKYFSAMERKKGYLRALEDYHIPLENSLIFQEEYDINGGYQACKNMLRFPAEKRPSAVLISSYFMTIGSIIAINEEGVRIPEDLSIICFDNYDLNKVFRPTLSCISQPSGEICRKAVDFMLERILSGVEYVRMERITAQFQLGRSVNEYHK